MYRIIVQETAETDQDWYPEQWPTGNWYPSFAEALFDFLHIQHHYHAIWIENENGATQLRRKA